MAIKNIIKKILYRLGLKTPPSSEEWRKYVKIGQNTRTQDFHVDARNPITDKVYMEIGDNCNISGRYVFEIGTGKITIGNNTAIGGGLFICIDGIDIGSDVLFSWGCTVADNNSHSVAWTHRKTDVADWKRGLDENKIGFYKDWTHVKRSPVRVKDKAWIGFDVVILKGVTIGEGAVVAAGSVVTKDVPDWTVVAGNPAKVVRIIPESDRV